MSDYLHALEQQSIHVIREAYARLKPLAMLWSLGKDSNTMVWLVRKAFLGRVPFPVMLLDTGNEFPEVYAFRDRLLRRMGPRLRQRAMPAGRGDRRDAAAGRARRGAQDAGIESDHRRAGLPRASCSASAATSN